MNVAKRLTLALLAVAALPLGGPAKNGLLFEQVDLFEVPSEGYRSYRIPAVAVTKRGVVLVFAAARRAVSDWAHTDLMMRRSNDGGRTWSPRRILATSASDTIDNPTVIASSDGTVHFLYQVNYRRLFYMRSKDDGRTFSTPVDITATVAQYRSEYDWNVVAPGPGHGIELANNRLLAPVWLSTGGRSHRPSRVSVIYSDDKGRKWKRGELLPDTLTNMSESVAVQLADGRVMLNIRTEDPRYRRAISYSRDGATRWSTPEQHEDLYDPICMASMVRMSAKTTGGKSVILFANPDSRAKTEVLRASGVRPRENFTLKVSYDEGKTWPVARVLEPGRAAYSDMAVLPDGTILVFYERGFIEDNNLNNRFLSLARLNLAWLTAAAESK